MEIVRLLPRLCGAAAILFVVTELAFGQTGTAPADHQHETAAMTLFDLREASGTAWLPDATPMFGSRHSMGGWDVMLHGNVFGQFLYESGEAHRTSHQAGSINWLMAMARRPAGAGRIGLRAMVSAEPWTIRGCGYPNLLATGELCDGDTIHDRQHPHDLFMEIAADYERPLRGDMRWGLYAGLAGEPALGPPAFPHRLSALPNPIAPISHHWLDSTHVAFGVVTTGVSSRRWRAEASLFNGREPDEDRLGVDLAALDSFSARLALMPAQTVALQVSAAHLEDGEAGLGTEPRRDVERITASMSYHRGVGGGDAMWATTIAYGQNNEPGHLPGDPRLRTHALLIESSVTSAGPHSWFGRFDIVEKPADDLHVHEFADRMFTVAKVQGGYVRTVGSWKGWRVGIGGTVSASIVPPLLALRYEGRVAPGGGVFFNFAPPRHRM
jgi:hypothetical protein